MNASYQLTELQEKWLKALESGEYRQGRHRLKRGDTFCCLGVACLASGKVFDGEYCEGVTGVAPRSVETALGLRGDSGVAARAFYINGKTYSNLTSANDDGVAFSEIAAVIRADPENFFLPVEAK